MRKFLKSIIPNLAAIAVLNGVAYAAADQLAEHWNWPAVWWRVANFILFAGTLYFLLRKPVAKFFAERRAKIEQEFSDLEARKATAQERLREVEARIANLETERQAILGEYRAHGEALQKSILEKAEAQARQIKEQARFAAANESKTAIDELRAQMADLLAEAASDLLRQNLSEKDHEKLIDKYLEKVVLQ